MTERTEAWIRYQTAWEYVEAIHLILGSHSYKDRHVLWMFRPTHFLAGFAIELYLKAWLLRDEHITSSSVRGLGHDLVRLYAKARSCGFPDIPGFQELLDVVSLPHREFTYRYSGSGDEPSVLNWNVVLAILDELRVVVDERLGVSSSQGLEPHQCVFPQMGIKLPTDPEIQVFLSPADEIA